MKLHPFLDDPRTVVVYRKAVPPAVAWSDFRQAAREVLAAMRLVLEGEKAVLKPNVTAGEHFANPETGIQTHPAFVWGMAEYLQAHGVRRGGIYVLEDPRDTDDNEPRHWKGTGYPEVASATGAKLRCPTSYTCVNKKVPHPLCHPDRKVSRLAVDEDTVLINVPKFKTHNLGIATLCMKNLMGVVNVWDRHYCGQSYHDLSPEAKELAGKQRRKRLVHELCQEGLGKRLADLSQVVRPHLNVVEGIVGRDGSGFQQGRNYPLGLVVAGTNVVAVDSVASYLMGFDPRKIIYLRIAAEAGLGSNQVSRLRLYEARDGELRRCRDLESLRLRPRFRLITGASKNERAYNL
jgi:uncharacterized protein (DUF362 family)